MSNITLTSGESAGKIWRALNEGGTSNKNEIIKLTKLNKSEFYTGVGWLAREDKISREGENNYKLDNTNLTDEVGKTAGKIYKVMDIWGEVDIPILKKLVNVDEKELYIALGWLAREDKIVVDEKTRINIK